MHCIRTIGGIRDVDTPCSTVSNSVPLRYMTLCSHFRVCDVTFCPSVRYKWFVYMLVWIFTNTPTKIDIDEVIHMTHPYLHSKKDGLIRPFKGATGAETQLRTALENC